MPRTTRQDLKRKLSVASDNWRQGSNYAAAVAEHAAGQHPEIAEAVGALLAQVLVCAELLDDIAEKL